MLLESPFRGELVAAGASLLSRRAELSLLATTSGVIWPERESDCSFTLVSLDNRGESRWCGTV
jgi:hypothetical protein